MKEKIRYIWGIFGEALILISILLIPILKLAVYVLAAYGLYSLLN